jgi:hypothetical protein
MGTPPEKVETAIAPPVDEGKQSVTPQQLAIVGGVVLVLVLGLLYFFVLRGDGEEEIPPPPTAEGVPAPTETEEPEVPEDDDDDDEIETFEVFAPRDPFEPLVSAAGGGGGTTVDDGGTVDDGTVDDGVDTGVVDGGDPEPDGDNIGNHRVKVVDVYTQNGEGRAQIQVDGTVYTVDEGEGFADNFRLVSTSGTCATILFGDDEFTLCEGEEILK